MISLSANEGYYSTPNTAIINKLIMPLRMLKILLRSEFVAVVLIKKISNDIFLYSYIHKELKADKI
jgi:hypothetical protein